MEFLFFSHKYTWNLGNKFGEKIFSYNKYTIVNFFNTERYLQLFTEERLPHNLIFYSPLYRNKLLQQYNGTFHILCKFQVFILKSSNPFKRSWPYDFLEVEIMKS